MKLNGVIVVADGGFVNMPIEKNIKNTLEQQGSDCILPEVVRGAAAPLTLTRSELFCRSVFQRPFRPNVQYLFTTKFSGMVMARFKNGASHCGTRIASTQSSSSSQFSTNVPP